MVRILAASAYQAGGLYRCLRTDEYLSGKGQAAPQIVLIDEGKDNGYGYTARDRCQNQTADHDQQNQAGAVFPGGWLGWQ